MELYNRAGVRLRLKVRLLKAEVIDTLIYGYMTWSPNNPDYDKLRQLHHSMVLRCETEPRRPHPLVRRGAFTKTPCKSIEVTVRNRGILFAGALTRMGEERLPRRVMFGYLVGGKGYSGRQ